MSQTLSQRKVFAANLNRSKVGLAVQVLSFYGGGNGVIHSDMVSGRYGITLNKGKPDEKVVQLSRNQFRILPGNRDVI